MYKRRKALFQNTRKPAFPCGLTSCWLVRPTVGYEGLGHGAVLAVPDPLRQ